MYFSATVQKPWICQGPQRKLRNVDYLGFFLHEPGPVTHCGREQGAGRRPARRRRIGGTGTPTQSEKQQERGNGQVRQVEEQPASKTAVKRHHGVNETWRLDNLKASTERKGQGAWGGLCRQANLKGWFPLRQCFNPHHAQPKPAADRHQRDRRREHLQSRRKELV